MLLLATVLLTADLNGLTIDASSPQKTILVAEPLKLTLHWKASKAVKDVALEEPAFLFQSLLLSVDDGKGPRIYRESPHEFTEKLLVLRSLRPGDEEIVNLVFFKGGYVDSAGGMQDGPLFPVRGKYIVKVLYMHDGVLSTVASNALWFDVGEPTGADREILEAVRRNPDLLRARGGVEDRSLTRKLVEQHPNSPYLRWARLEQFRQRASAVESSRDPDTGESVYHLGKDGLAEFGRQHHRRLAEGILSGGDWGPFEEEALALGCLYAQNAGDREMSERARRDLFEKYPRSAIVKRIKEAEARPGIDEDDEPAATPPPKRKD